MFDLTGKTALVTGSTQGIGYAVASCLAEQGATVFVHGSKSMEKCEKASAGIPGSRPVTADLSESGSCSELYRKTGDVDILVLNASVQIRKPWNQITPEEFNLQVHVNLLSTLELMKLYGPYMAKKGWGRIVAVGSVQQYKPHPEMGIYAATKDAQYNLVRNVAKQMAPYGVTVNNMSPGVIATPRNEAALSDPEYSKKVMDGIPCGYAGRACDCSGGVLLLCSEEGRYIIGTDLVIDGGMHL